MRPVLAWPQEKGTYDDASCAALYAPAIGRSNGRFGQLHVGRLDNLVLLHKSLCEQPRQLFEHPVALCQTRPVVHDDDPAVHGPIIDTNPLPARNLAVPGPATGATVYDSSNITSIAGDGPAIQRSPKDLA